MIRNKCNSNQLVLKFWGLNLVTLDMLNCWFTLVGTQGRMKLIPWLPMYSPIFSAICWSNPRSNMDRTMMETSRPIAWRKPPHSRATYEAPTTRVFPGQYGKENKSSLKYKQYSNSSYVTFADKTSVDFIKSYVNSHAVNVKF